MRASALNLLVFREDRRSLRGLELRDSLAHDLELLNASSQEDDLLHALLRAGELECGAADVGSASAEAYMTITDRVAELLVARSRGTGIQLQLDGNELIGILGNSQVPEQVEITPAEGFAYYALHPLAFAEALDRISVLPATVTFVGIRSIGTTLSAVAAAETRRRGKTASRFTVRPAGHPYSRETRLSPAQLAFVHLQVACGAGFVVVDEGPGLSGSSFLSVAEALVGAGVSREKIILLCAHEPDFDALCAENASERARKFCWIAVSSDPRRPPGAEIFVGGGQWRRHLFPKQRDWPESWISFERLKYLSSLNRVPARLFKFAGLGHYGEQVRAREQTVAAAGYGPAPKWESQGFVSYAWIYGRPMSAEDLSHQVLARLAAYCAFRAEAFKAELTDLSALAQMAEHNLLELGVNLAVGLRLERPVLADGRMQPHEWMLTQDGQILKTDSGSHGDDHFFPGATDIAWDLAGAIVEWRMTAAQAEAFLEAYRRASGDEARTRILSFVIAYTVFRWAYSTMAASRVQATDEREPLERAAVKYSTHLVPTPENSRIWASFLSEPASQSK
jgi:hypothetical protein